jgi:murein DD-endopeptidase MepM/ murein hydrolase activator NlpD
MNNPSGCPISSPFCKWGYPYSRINVLVLAWLFAATMAVVDSTSARPAAPITICHKPGTAAEQTLIVPEPALKGHLQHGDTLGACGTRTTGSISPAGGTLQLTDILRIVFPAGAFSSTARVSIRTTQSDTVAAAFDETTVVFRPLGRLPYEVRINTGVTPPISDTVDVEFAVPEAFFAALPPNAQINVFAQIFQDGGQEVLDEFELFQGAFDAASRRFFASLPTQMFTTARTQDGTWEAILTLAAIPGPPQTAQTQRAATANPATLLVQQQLPPECKGVNIGCPLHGLDCVAKVSSGYNRAGRNLNGVVRPHHGVDFGVPEGTRVDAAADGVVERSYTSTTYGEVVIVRHTNGSATLYAHLQRRDVAVNDPVTVGKQLGVSGNTGASLAPHLHLEYVPNGEIIRSPFRVDPLKCVGETLNGAITVKDNGNLADDAFAVIFDNVPLGRTTIGGENTLAVSNLLPGVHSLIIVGIVVPDNVGTFEVRLSQGLTFGDGSTVQSDVVSLNGSRTYLVVVP